jgi:hypothetical protein
VQSLECRFAPISHPHASSSAMAVADHPAHADENM